jgi:excisionase family DNA binding protein
MPDKLLDAATVASILGVRPRYVLEMARRGDLPGVRVGPRYLRWRESEVMRYVARQEATPITATASH